MRKGGNPDIAKHGFKKGDPRINRKGAPKKIPKLAQVLEEVLGIKEGEDISKSKLKLVIEKLVDEAMSAKRGARTNAAREILDRTFGKVPTVAKIDMDMPEPNIVVNITKLKDDEI